MNLPRKLGIAPVFLRALVAAQAASASAFLVTRPAARQIITNLPITANTMSPFSPVSSTNAMTDLGAQNNAGVDSANADAGRGTVNKAARPALRGVVFDMDGTLTKPAINFAAMYDECNVPLGSDILAEIAQMSPSDAQRANAIVTRMEEEARTNLELMPGAVEVGKWLANHGVRIGLITRNTARTVDSLRERWAASGGPEFSCALSRDNCNGLPPKPHPAGLVEIATRWDIDLSAEGESVVMVGDSPRHDVVFGKAAGVATALLDIEDRYCKEDGSDQGAEFKVEGLWQLPSLFCKHYDIPGQLGTGKPLVYYDPPQAPSDRACIAAYAGAVTVLKSLPAEESNRPDDTGNTPLIWAAEAGKVEVVRYLLSIPDINVNHRGYLGATAICRASRRGHANVIRLLALEGGADMDIPNIKMQYPLHFAAFKQMTEAVDVLLECGANTLVLDRKGRTPAEDTSDDCIRDRILVARKRALEVAAIQLHTG